MGDFEIKNGVLKIYKGNSSHVVIPDGVTRIDESAFRGCTNLTSIEIPNSVTSIGDYAFRDCENLSSVNIPNSVTYIGYEAFQRCISLTNIEIPNGVTVIGEGVFCGCKSLTSIKIPNSVIRILERSFYYCPSLTSIEIPNSVRFIRQYAFNGLPKVKPQYKPNGSLRAFKAFHKDWTCRDFQYEIGKSYHQTGKIECCSNGFHACINPLTIFNYYYGHLDDLHFAEVELSGTMDSWWDDKVAASDINIIRELTASELADIYNKMEKYK